MKTNYFLFLLLASFFLNAQNKITFDYDDAGNQYKRELCLSCSDPRYKTIKPKEIKALKEGLRKILSARCHFLLSQSSKRRIVS